MGKDHNPSWELIYSTLEQLAVVGNHEGCRKILNNHNPKKIPRIWATQFGELAFRINLPIYALKVLQPFVYPENELQVSATDKEKVIYSTALSSLGAVRRAIEILDEVDFEREPEALFHRASAEMYAWNYVAAIPFLKKYISSPLISPYRQLVGKVNLASALIDLCDWPSARSLLLEIQMECQEKSYGLLLGNSYELQAQIEIFQGHYEPALDLLDKALVHLKDQGGFYSLYVEKWTTICRCLQSNGEANEIAKLITLREKALELGHWNTIRECDLFTALATKNQELFRKAIIGTPSETYRRRARRLFGTNLISMGQYHFYLGDETANKEQVAVFNPWKKTETSEALYEKPMLFSLFDALVSDFYQPHTLGILFEKLYPNEKFNPFTSPQRTLQLLRRLNSWFTKNHWPLRVEFKKSEFKLITSQNIFVLVQRGKTPMAADGKFLALKTHFQDKSFTIDAVVGALQISRATVEKMLSKAFMDGKLSKERNRHGVVYRLAARKRKAA